MKFDYTKPIVDEVFYIPEANVDTDQMVPARFLADGSRCEYGDAFFYDWRFHEDGSEKSQHPFKLSEKRKILLTGPNFGCGSSREHAVWGMRDFGIQVVIGSSFGDIFKSNCYKNQILAICLEQEEVSIISSHKGPIRIDLDLQQVGFLESIYNFELDPFIKLCLLKGIDQTQYILEKGEFIQHFESCHDKTMIRTDALIAELNR